MALSVVPGLGQAACSRSPLCFDHRRVGALYFA